ncbi:hypothetical protein IFR04_000451 [Cadophora malorum]|uniref:Uncharacterized protein n=1 Tax=Cadophora malorum TaxID=108018 RepID=A0A8H7WKJ1_9HELO|nr:hypothetical protein IFR04_000451 [Cadophora malorum]
MDDQAGGDRFEFIDEWRERVEAYEKEKQEKLIKLYDQEIVHDLELLKRPWEKSRRPPSSGDDYVSYDKSTFFTKFLPEWPLDWLDQYAAKLVDPDELTHVDELTNNVHFLSEPQLKCWGDDLISSTRPDLDEFITMVKHRHEDRYNGTETDPDNPMWLYSPHDTLLYNLTPSRLEEIVESVRDKLVAFNPSYVTDGDLESTTRLTAWALWEDVHYLNDTFNKAINEEHVEDKLANKQVVIVDEEYQPMKALGHQGSILSPQGSLITLSYRMQNLH